MYNFKLSEKAEADLLAILTYISFDLSNPEAADNLNADIFKKTVTLPCFQRAILLFQYQIMNTVVR